MLLESSPHDTHTLNYTPPSPTIRLNYAPKKPQTRLETERCIYTTRHWSVLPGTTAIHPRSPLPTKDKQEEPRAHVLGSTGGAPRGAINLDDWLDLTTPPQLTCCAGLIFDESAEV